MHNKTMDDFQQTLVTFLRDEGRDDLADDVESWDSKTMFQHVEATLAQAKGLGVSVQQVARYLMEGGEA